MKLQLAFVCDGASPDPEGRLDVKGIFHDLYAPGFPAKQERMMLVLGIEWNREDVGRYEFQVDLHSPDGSPTLTVQGHTDIDRRAPDRPPARTQLTMPLENVVFRAPGPYVFKVRIKGRTIDGPTIHLIEAEVPHEGAIQA